MGNPNISVNVVVFVHLAILGNVGMHAGEIFCILGNGPTVFKGLLFFIDSYL